MQLVSWKRRRALGRGPSDTSSPSSAALGQRAASSDLSSSRGGKPLSSPAAVFCSAQRHGERFPTPLGDRGKSGPGVLGRPGSRGCPCLPPGEGKGQWTQGSHVAAPAGSHLWGPPPGSPPRLTRWLRPGLVTTFALPGRAASVPEAFLWTLWGPLSSGLGTCGPRAWVRGLGTDLLSACLMGP